MTAIRPDNRRRAYWLKTLHEWHWVSSAICLIGMILFSVTGFTLNHASQIEAKPVVTRLNGSIDEALRAQLEKQLPAAKALKGKAPLPPELQAWVQKHWDISTASREAEWSDDEIYLSLPRPGGDAWLRLSLSDGEIEYERTDRGWLSYFNDLHKGRNTGTAWRWFIDLFAAACLLFALTGLWLLQLHARQRGKTWPLVALGLLLPLLIVVLFMH